MKFDICYYGSPCGIKFTIVKAGEDHKINEKYIILLEEFKKQVRDFNEVFEIALLKGFFKYTMPIHSKEKRLNILIGN